MQVNEFYMGTELRRIWLVPILIANTEGLVCRVWDHYERENKSFRLFLPIYNCNPPFNYFILDDKILHFEHGRMYFLNTCKEHIEFTSARGGKGRSM